jgi:hypothetical protein
MTETQFEQLVNHTLDGVYRILGVSNLAESRAVYGRMRQAIEDYHLRTDVVDAEFKEAQKEFV